MKKFKRRYRGRRVCKDEESKAKSLQTAFRFATDRKETLPITDARKIVSNPPICPYCNKKIPYRDISIDHIQPRSRGGSSKPENLIFCDRNCNLAKGNLTGEEFTVLMNFLGGFTFMKNSILQRLIAAGRVFGRGRR